MKKRIYSCGFLIVSLLFLMLQSCLDTPKSRNIHNYSSKPFIINEFPKPDKIKMFSSNWGMVDLNKEEEKIGVSSSFLSLSKRNWDSILSPQASLGFQILNLQKIYEETNFKREKFWAAYFLSQIYHKGLDYSQEAFWLKASLQLYQSDMLNLSLAWIFQFEKVPGEVIPIFKKIDQTKLGASNIQKWIFLRKALFFNTLDITQWGIDDHISCLKVDHDDLWISTWNGGLARYSLVTKDVRVLLKPDRAKLAPIRMLLITPWFVYVFKDSGFSRFSKVGETWRDFSYPQDFNGLRLQDVVLINDTSFWAAQLGQGLWLWKEGEWIDENAGLPSRFINHIERISQGFWIGFQDLSGGYLSENGQFQFWNNCPENVTAWIKDDELNTPSMVGSFSQGLWHREKNTRYERMNLPDMKLSTIEDIIKGKKLWIATLDYGVIAWDGKKWESYGPDQGFPYKDVTNLASWGDFVFWGTMSGGLGIWYDYED